MILSIGAVVGLSLWAAYNRNKAASAAEDQVAQMEDAAAVLEEARANALENEMACLQERQALATRLRYSKTKEIVGISSFELRILNR